MLIRFDSSWCETDSSVAKSDEILFLKANNFIICFKQGKQTTRCQKPLLSRTATKHRVILLQNVNKTNIFMYLNPNSSKKS